MSQISHARIKLKGLPWNESHKICSNIIFIEYSWMNHKNRFSYHKKIGAKVSRARARAHCCYELTKWARNCVWTKEMQDFNAIKCEKQASMFVNIFYVSVYTCNIFRCCLPIAISFCLHSTGLQWIIILEWIHTLPSVYCSHIIIIIIGYCLSVRRAQYKRLLFTFNQRPAQWVREVAREWVCSVSIEFHFDTYGLV